MQGFTLLKVDLTREDDDPGLTAVRKKYAAETLPAIRLVGPDGSPRGKTDALMSSEEFLALLVGSTGRNIDRGCRCSTPPNESLGALMVVLRARRAYDECDSVGALGVDRRA